MILSPPPVQNYVQSPIAALVHRADAINSGFWNEHSTVFPEASVSAFWTRLRQFIQLSESARKAKTFDRGWDGYDAPAPDGGSVDRTLEVLSKVRDSKLTPYSVLPSADGGVGISFRGSGGKRAVLEILNDGTSSYMLYGKGHTAEGSPFDSNTELPRILQRLEAYL